MQPKALGGNVVAEGDRWGASATMALGRWSLQLNRRGAFGLDTVAAEGPIWRASAAEHWEGQGCSRGCSSGRLCYRGIWTELIRCQQCDGEKCEEEREVAMAEAL